MSDSFSNYCFKEDFNCQQTVQDKPDVDTKIYDLFYETKRKKTDIKSLKVKKEQAAMTIKWLKTNYCACPEVCLPREIIYGHYLEFCKTTCILPACKATFGKLIRNTFPTVTSKRLGARGQSKYHYNGIGIQQSSEYFQTITHNGVTRFSSISSKNEDSSSKKFSLTSKIGTLLPSFPDYEDLIFPHSVNKEKIKIFLTMYRIHCQCIVDTTIGGSFEETRLFLLHFWQGFPDHLISIFNDDLSLNIIAACDSIFYRTLIDVLIPTEVVEIPENRMWRHLLILLCGIQNLSSHWGKWLEGSLENMPLKLRELKMIQGRRFCKSLKRNAAFLHLAQVTRPLLNKKSLHLLAKELTYLQTEESLKITIAWTKAIFPKQMEALDILDALENLLEKEFFTTALIDLSDSIVREVELGNVEDMTNDARLSLLNWVHTLSKISFWLTENKSDNFITFHMISLLIQEYLLLAFETVKNHQEEHLIHLKMQMHLKSLDKRVETSFKSPTSCFLVTDKKQRHSCKRIKQSESENTHISRRETFANLNHHEIQLPHKEPYQSWRTQPYQQLNSKAFWLRNENFQQNTSINSEIRSNEIGNYYTPEYYQSNCFPQQKFPFENVFRQEIMHTESHPIIETVSSTETYY